MDVAKQSIYNTKLIDWRLFIMEGCIFVSKVFTFFEWFSLSSKGIYLTFFLVCSGWKSSCKQTEGKCRKGTPGKWKAKNAKDPGWLPSYLSPNGGINPSLLISIQFFFIFFFIWVYTFLVNLFSLFCFKEFVFLKQKPWSYVWYDSHF